MQHCYTSFQSCTGCLCTILSGHCDDNFDEQGVSCMYLAHHGPECASLLIYQKRVWACRWEWLESGAGAPVLVAASLPPNRTGPWVRFFTGSKNYDHLLSAPCMPCSFLHPTCCLLLQAAWLLLYVLRASLSSQVCQIMQCGSCLLLCPDHHDSNMHTHTRPDGNPYLLSVQISCSQDWQTQRKDHTVVAG